MNVQIRPQRVYDAKRYYEILSSPGFIYFPVKPKSIEEEKKFLRMNSDKRKRGTEFNFSIIYKEKHVGAIGVRVDQFRSFIGEVGYFIDENFWCKGITTYALKQLENYIVSNLSLHRLEIRMAKKNKASQKIAIKSGYKKEGILKQMLLVGDHWYDCYLYSKII